MQGLRVEVAQAALEEPRSALKAPLAELKSGVRASVLMDGARVRFFWSTYLAVPCPVFCKSGVMCPHAMSGEVEGRKWRCGLSPKQTCR